MRRSILVFLQIVLRVTGFYMYISVSFQMHQNRLNIVSF